MFDCQASTTIVTTQCVVIRTRLHAHRREAPRSSQRSAPSMGGNNFSNWFFEIFVVRESIPELYGRAYPVLPLAAGPRRRTPA